jgi:hypothetical protein
MDNAKRRNMGTGATFTRAGNMFNPLYTRRRQDGGRFIDKKDLEAILAVFQHVSPPSARAREG